MKRTVLHCLAAAVLVAASIAIWHWRFVADPDALPETRLATPLIGWICPPNRTHEIIQQDNGPLLVLERPTAKDKHPGIHVLYEQLEHVKFVHIRCSYRWQDVTPGPQTYMSARFVGFMKDASGTTSHPEGGFQIFGGRGTSEWKKGEVVQRLTSDMLAYGLSIAMLGNTGRLEVRDLSVTAVRQRQWIPLATSIVVAGWICLCASLIRIRSVAPRMGRSIAGALVLVTAGWILVFPQTKNFLRPIPHSFEIGETKPSPPPSSKPAVQEAAPETPAPPEARPPNPETPETKPVERAPSNQPKAPPTRTPVETRDSGTLFHLLYEVDQRFPAAHFVLFVGLTLLVLLITGESTQWHLPLLLALLSEIVPELTDRLGGADDWVDVLSNIAGVGIAVFLWLRLPILKRFRLRTAD